jgi:putative phage-type endonuclease
VNAPVAPAAVTERQRFIGGSDVAGILGVSPWDTPLDIYLKKTGQRPDTEPDPAKAKLFRWGKLLEPVIIEHLRQDYGIEVTKISTPDNPNRYVDPEHPFLAAEIDFEWRVSQQNAEDYAFDQALVGTIQNGEIKTVHQFAAAKFGDELTEDVPIEYAAQAMHGLMIKGRQLTLFGVLTGTRDVTIYWIKRDDDTIRALRPQVVAFWHKHVLAGVPPEPVNLPDVVKLFHRTPPTQCEVTQEIVEKITRLEFVRASMSQLEDEDAELKFEIGKHVLGASGILLGKGGKLEVGPTAKPGQHILTLDGAPIFQIALQEQSRLDSARLAAERPEIVSAFQKPIKFFKFARPPKPKGKKR